MYIVNDSNCCRTVCIGTSVPNSLLIVLDSQLSGGRLLFAIVFARANPIAALLASSQAAKPGQSHSAADMRVLDAAKRIQDMYTEIKRLQPVQSVPHT